MYHNKLYEIYLGFCFIILKSNQFCIQSGKKKEMYNKDLSANLTVFWNQINFHLDLELWSIRSGKKKEMYSKNSSVNMTVLINVWMYLGFGFIIGLLLGDRLVEWLRRLTWVQKVPGSIPSSSIKCSCHNLRGGAMAMVTEFALNLLWKHRKWKKNMISVGQTYIWSGTELKDPGTPPKFVP